MHFTQRRHEMESESKTKRLDGVPKNTRRHFSIESFLDLKSWKVRRRVRERSYSSSFLPF